MSVAPAAWRMVRSANVELAGGRIDAILRSCPTRADVEAIERDFRFTFDTDPGPIVCTPGGTEAGARLALINAFRCMRALAFDKPIPVLNETSVYAWLKRKGVRGIHFFDGPGPSNSGGPDRMLQLRRSVLDGKARTWADGSSARPLGIEGLIGLIVHETGHRDPGGKGHDCDARGRRLEPDPACGVTKSCPSFPTGWYVDNATGQRLFEARDDGFLYYPDGTRAPNFTTADDLASNDSSLEYGGAWAAQYAFFKACASHPALTDRERAHMERVAGWLVKDGRLSCGTRSETASVPAPPDTRPVVKRNAPPWAPQAKLQTARANVGGQRTCGPVGPDGMIVMYESPEAMLRAHPELAKVGALEPNAYWKPLSTWTQSSNRQAALVGSRPPPWMRAATVGATAKAPTKWTAADYRALAKAAKDIGTQPAYLLLVLYSESRLNTWAAAPGNHAVGLNQIVPVAAKALGMTEAQRLAILDMSVQEQLPIVVRSFRLMPGKFDSPQALYQYNAAPATMSKGSADSVVVYPAGSAGYKGNAGLDYDKDGVLTVGDLRMHLEALSKQPAFQAHLAAMTAATGASSDLGGSLFGGLPPNAFEWSVAALAGGAAYYLASTKWPWLAFWKGFV